MPAPRAAARCGCSPRRPSRWRCRSVASPSSVQAVRGAGRPTASARARRAARAGGRRRPPAGRAAGAVAERQPVAGRAAGAGRVRRARPGSGCRAPPRCTMPPADRDVGAQPGARGPDLEPRACGDIDRRAPGGRAAVDAHRGRSPGHHHPAVGVGPQRDAVERRLERRRVRRVAEQPVGERERVLVERAGWRDPEVGEAGPPARPGRSSARRLGRPRARSFARRHPLDSHVIRRTGPGRPG